LGKGLVQCAAASIVSASTNAHDPSGAAGGGDPKTSGFAETCGSCSWISIARR